MVEGAQCVKHRLCSGELVHDRLHLRLVIDDREDHRMLRLGVCRNLTDQKSSVLTGAGTVVGRCAGREDPVCLGFREEIPESASFHKRFSPFLSGSPIVRGDRRRILRFFRQDMKEIFCRLICVDHGTGGIRGDKSLLQCIQHGILTQIQVEKLRRMMSHQGIPEKGDESVSQKNADEQHDHCC